MGSALSRWTMSYFAAALFFLLVAEAMMAAGYGFPSVSIEAPETLVLVHLVTIGWLSLLMSGALLQFVPVLVARPLQAQVLALPALLCLLAGLLCLLAGFLDLAGSLDVDFPFLPAAVVLLPLGFLLIIAVIALTLWSAGPEKSPLPARFVTVGLASLIVTFALGGMFAAGFAPFEIRSVGLQVHVAMGLGGWLTFSAIGVSHRLLPMFMFAPEKDRATTRATWWCGVVALLLVVAQLPEGVIDGRDFWNLLALVFAVAMLSAYCVDLIQLYRSRKRRRVELNVRAAAGAFAALFVSALLVVLFLTSGSSPSAIGAVIYLIAMGWLTGLGLSQLYKIVPFLTWLECYGAVMGKKPTPRVQDLVVEIRAQLWFALYFLAVAVCTYALLIGSPLTFQLASTVVLMATAAVIAELIAARRLWNLPMNGSSDGSRQRLFLPRF